MVFYSLYLLVWTTTIHLSDMCYVVNKALFVSNYLCVNSVITVCDYCLLCFYC